MSAGGDALGIVVGSNGFYYDSSPGITATSTGGGANAVHGMTGETIQLAGIEGRQKY